MRISNNRIEPRREQLFGLIVGICGGLVVGVAFAQFSQANGIAILVCAIIGGVIGQGLAIHNEQTQKEVDLENEVVSAIGLYTIHVFVGAFAGLVAVLLVCFLASFWDRVAFDAVWVWIGISLGALFGILVGALRRL